ncbi:MAG: GNAT family N-acetyltransferase [Zoogloeaceae bacterium]|nr:GNAT family N-acetyltransferase [Zoogloeaceae bacterium]
MKIQLALPQPLAASHILDEFNCGESTLNDWLKRRALTNHLSGASRVFVVADAAQCVLGYYALAAGAIARTDATSAIRRNMPDPMPVMVLARLAVDVRVQGIKLGAALLRDAVARVQSVAEHAGVRALLVHALNERAKQFYEHYGFRASPIHPLTLMLSLKGNHLR